MIKKELEKEILSLKEDIKKLNKFVSGKDSIDDYSMVSKIYGIDVHNGDYPIYKKTNNLKEDVEMLYDFLKVRKFKTPEKTEFKKVPFRERNEIIEDLVGTLILIGVIGLIVLLFVDLF